MIAALEWVPEGRANPTPSKYEYSRAEQEFMSRVIAQHEDNNNDDVATANGKEVGNTDTNKNDNDGEWQDMSEEEEDTAGDKEEKKKVELPKVDPSSLPSDLNMDDYSDDDDNDNNGEEKMGDLLGIGKDAEILMKEANNYNSNSDDDSEDEDDLADVPDTREYMPLDLQGLQSIGIGSSGMSGKGGSGEDGQYTMKDLQAMTMNEDINDDDDDESEDDEDEINDTKLRPTDALLVIAKTEEDYASLEINIFDTESSNLYVHHDIPLPSYPLCLALGSVVSSYYRPESNDGNNGSSSGGGGVSSGNFVAVGSFEPGIEIWNLDVMNALEPTVVLGGMDTRGTEDDWMGMSAGKKKKSSKGSSGGGLRKGSHTDAIMGLSWNTVHQQVLASGSADGTVKLWDVTQCKGDYIEPSATLTHHTDKVQSLAWHPSEGTLLATGGYDRQVCLVDARSAASVASSNNSSNANVKKAKLLADCEAIAWDVHNQQYLTAASEDGVIQCWDVRKFGSDPVWSFVAHEYGISDFCYNSQVPGMLITCSIDKTVALWDTRKSTPEPCGSKEMNVGKLYSVRTYPSSPWLLACGGSGNELAIWDMEGEDAIQRRFAKGSNTETAAADQEEPDFESIMANNDATSNAAKSSTSNNKKKKKGKKKSKAHKRK